MDFKSTATGSFPFGASKYLWEEQGSETRCDCVETKDNAVLYLVPCDRRVTLRVLPLKGIHFLLVVDSLPLSFQCNLGDGESNASEFACISLSRIGTKEEKVKYLVPPHVLRQI